MVVAECRSPQMSLSCLMVGDGGLKRAENKQVGCIRIHFSDGSKQSGRATFVVFFFMTQKISRKYNR